MVGNAAEEGLMLQVDNPSHLDPGRIAVPAGALTTAAAYVAVSAAIPALGFWGAFLIAFGVGNIVGIAAYRRLNARMARKAAERQAADRAERLSDKQRQMKDLRRGAQKR